MQSSMIKSITEDFGNGGTIDGDLTISGDLTVSGGGSLSFDEIVQGTSTIKVTDTNAFLVEKADGTDVFVVDTTNTEVTISGSLGVGASPVSSFPAQNVTIEGATAGLVLRDTTGSNQATQFFTLYSSNGDIIGMFDDSKSLKFGHADDVVGTNYEDVLVITSDNRVGIGTSSPSVLAHFSSSSANQVRIERTTGGNTALHYKNTGEDWYSGVTSTSSFSISTNADIASGTDFVITNSGNVGIGTASPQSSLEIELGGDTGTYFEAGGNGASSSESDARHLKMTASTTTNAGDTHSINCESSSGVLKLQTAGTDRLTINSTSATFAGDVTVSKSGNAFLNLTSTGGGARIKLTGQANETTNGLLFYEASNQRGQINYNHSDQKMEFKTGDSTTLALTLDSSQDAIFANTAIFPNNKSINFLNTSGAEKAIISFDSSNITKIGDASSSGTLQLNSGVATFANAVMINSSSANYADLTVGGTGDIVALRASSGTAGFTMYEAGTGRFNMTTLNGSNGIAFKVPTTTALTIDSSADATFANNLTVNGDTLSLVKSNNNAFLKIESTAGGEAFIDMRSTTNKTNVIRFFEGTTQKGSVVYSHASQSLTFNTGDSATSKLVLDDNSRISLSNNDSGSNNTIFGKSASPSQAGSNNTIVGENTALAMDGGESHNTVIGNNAMRGADEGASGSIDFNVAIGSSALWGGVLSGTNQVTGNIAIGYQALYKTDDTNPSIGQIAIGYQSLKGLTSGERNTAVGFESLKSNTIGDKNTAVGYQALESFNADTDGHGNNTAIGHNAMQGNNTGTDNVAIGHMSAFSGTNNMTSGDNNTFIGSLSTPSSGTPTNQTVIGYNATGQADNSVTLGNADVTAVYMAQDGDAVMYADGTINTSDKRLKENISDSDLGLAFINELRPVSYNLKSKKHSAKLKYGIVAQEVKEVLKESGNEDFAGITDKGEYLGADYVQFIAPLIKAVQELTAKVKELESK